MISVNLSNKNISTYQCIYCSSVHTYSNAITNTDCEVCGGHRCELSSTNNTPTEIKIVDQPNKKNKMDVEDEPKETMDDAEDDSEETTEDNVAEVETTQLVLLPVGLSDDEMVKEYRKREREIESDKEAKEFQENTLAQIEHDYNSDIALIRGRFLSQLHNMPAMQEFRRSVKHYNNTSRMKLMELPFSAREKIPRLKKKSHVTLAALREFIPLLFPESAEKKQRLDKIMNRLT